jgi:heme exporter protein B
MSSGNFFSQVLALIRKDMLIELRNKYVFGSVLLFSASTVMIIYFSLLYNGAINAIEASVWSILFWMVILFSAVNAVSNAFFRETEGQLMNYYFLFSPLVYITSKIIYNVIYTLLLSVVGSLFFFTVISNPVKMPGIFSLVIILGSLSYAILFTIMSAIAVKAKSNNTLVAVLGFPILIPMMIFITKVTAAALGSIEQAELVYKNLMLIAALDLMQITLAVILFPYIWRE